MSNNDGIEDKIFFSKYKPDKKLGEGSFGKIYSAININTQDKYALKLENKKEGQNLLESEAYVLCYLKGIGIPSVKSYGFSGDYNILVFELLGKSLEDLFQDQQCKYSMKTVCMLGDQMLSRIEYVHSKHIIHRDIKPDNFLMGIRDSGHMVYIIDFGLAKKYRSSRTMQHIKYTNNKKLTGTARYASINALRGCEQSRRDDLEAIGYVIMYFLRGSLPWQGLKIDKKEDRYKKIYDKKKNTTAEELCAGFPSELVDYVNYTRNLGFEEDPDYEYLRGLFKQIMSRFDHTYDFDYDWSRKYGIKTIPKTTPEVNPKANEKKQKDKNAVNYVHTNANVNTENERQVNQVNNNNFKFIETLNNKNDERTNTMKVNMNTVVDGPENKNKFMTTIQANKENRETNMIHTENPMETSASKKKKEKDKCCIL